MIYLRQYLERTVIREVKSRKNFLAMAWIDYKKAYDMVPHSWIKEYLHLFGVAENIKTLLVNIMGKWESNVVCKEFRVMRSRY